MTPSSSWNQVDLVGAGVNVGVGAPLVVRPSTPHLRCCSAETQEMFGEASNPNAVAAAIAVAIGAGNVGVVCVEGSVLSC